MPTAPNVPKQLWPLAKLLADTHIFLYRASNGRIGSNIGGLPMLLLTTTGRRSGKSRTTPLLYVEQNGSYAVIASKGGSKDDPLWWLNLKSNPQAILQVGSSQLAVKARLAGAEQRKKLWKKATEIYPGYDEYQKRTSRKIPVVVLKPV